LVDTITEAKEEEESEPEPNVFFGITANPGISRLNIASIFIIQFCLMLVLDDYISLEQPLLMNKQYYA
jgi:hypothetical protein